MSGVSERPPPLAVVITGEGMPDHGGSGANQYALAVLLAGRGHSVAFASRWPLGPPGQRIAAMAAAGVTILSPRLAARPLARIWPTEYNVRRIVRQGRAIVRTRGRSRPESDPGVVRQRDYDVHAMLARKVAHWSANHRLPTVAHVIGRECGPLIPVLRELELPVVFTELGQLLNLGLDVTTAGRLGADAYTADSTAAGRVLERLEGRSVAFVPGIGGYVGPPAKIPNLASRFIMACRLDWVKRVEVAIRAAALVPQIYLDVHGDGPERGRLERLVAELHLGERVRLRGLSRPAEVRRAMCSSHAFLLSSGESEGTPVAMIEAMSLGLAVVSTPVGGVTDIVHHGVEGLLCDQSAGELAVAMLRLSSEPGLAASMGAASRRRWIEEMAPEKVACEYEAIYRAIHGKGWAAQRET